MHEPPEPTGPVLFFDGECGLCNRVVRLMMRLDRAGGLRYGPLQGPHGQAYLRAKGLPTEAFSTLVYVPSWANRADEVPLFRTDGVIAAFAACGSVGRALGGALRVLPQVVRDGLYRGVARVRYRIFGAWKPTPLPDPAWQLRLID